MYESFYGLKSKPFLTVPDPGFLYMSRGHDLALTMLRYGLMTAAPITVITGAVGAGKTTLLRHLMNEMPEELTVGLVSNMQAGRGALLEWVMMAFGQPYAGKTHVELFQAFQQFVIDRYAEGHRVVLICDEAQNLDVPTLEELRLLSNINIDGEQLLQLILVGQPQLRELVSDPRLTQFAQRIVADFHLEPLEAGEVEPYIDRRLKVAGAHWKIFPRETCRLIHVATGGVPRLINSLCDLCLVSGFSAEEKVIGPAMLREFLASAERHAIYRQFNALPPAEESGSDSPSPPASSPTSPPTSPAAAPRGHDAPPRDASRPDGPGHDGAGHDGARHDGARHDGAGREGYDAPLVLTPADRMRAQPRGAGAATGKGIAGSGDGGAEVITWLRRGTDE